jgi:transcription elongation factor Elf1
MRKPKRTLIKQKSGSFICPVCSSIIIWTCSLGNRGYAYCSKSLNATQTIPINKNSIGTKIKAYCDWTGTVRRKNEKIIIICNR